MQPYFCWYMLRRLTDWILFTSIFAALCAMCMCMATEKLVLGSTPHAITTLHLLLFSSTLVVYNLHFILRTMAQVNEEHWSKYKSMWHWVMVVAGSVGLLFSLFYVSADILGWCAVMGVCSFMYSFPLLPFANKRRLKDYGWGKIIALVTVWVIATCVLPILYLHNSITDYPFEILIRTSMLLALCIAFDIRDMQADAQKDIQTIPNRIGAARSYVLIDVSIIVFAISSIIQYFRYPHTGRLVAELITAMCMKVVMLYVKKHPSDKAYLGLVDGMMLLYALLIILLN